MPDQPIQIILLCNNTDVNVFIVINTILFTNQIFY
jgi:hypothetical protein